MNNERRKKVQKQIQALGDVIEVLKRIQKEIETIKDEEDEAFYNLPESLQSSDRGSDMELNVENLQEVEDDIDETVDQLDDILEKLCEVD